VFFANAIDTGEFGGVFKEVPALQTILNLCIPDKEFAKPPS
jgi:hypothetical protein